MFTRTTPAHLFAHNNVECASFQKLGRVLLKGIERHIHVASTKKSVSAGTRPWTPCAASGRPGERVGDGAAGICSAGPGTGNGSGQCEAGEGTG